MNQAKESMNMQMTEKTAAMDSGALKQFLDAGVRKTLGLAEHDLDAGLKLAGIRISSGKYEMALRLYRTLLILAPNDFRIYQGLANLCHKTGDHDKVLHCASAMIALKPADPLGYYFSAMACLALGHLEEANEDLTDAMARIGNNEDIRLKEACKKLSLLLVSAE